MPTPKPHFVVGKSAFVCGNRFQECRIGPGHVREQCLNLLDHSIPPMPFYRGRKCQGKVEMSYSLQSRNVRFCGAGERVRVILTMPVKQRRAMLASNPIEE